MKYFIVTTVLFTSAVSGQLDGNNRGLGPGSGNRRADTVLSSKFLDAADYYDDVVDDYPVPSNLRPPPHSPTRNRDRSGGGDGGGRPIGPKLRPNQIPGLLGQQDCRSKTRTLPHEKYCDLYYHTTGCDDGQSLLRSCPNGLVFTGSGRHGLIGVCDYTHNAECPPGKEKHNPPISTEHCDWLYGIFGHETSCTRYWTCWNGTATEQFCVGGLLYNEDTHACDWPQNVVGCQKHPLCKDDANGNVPLGKSCNRYWACQGGYPRLQRCPAMLVFDKQRKRCVSPPTEDCDVPPTQAPEDDDRDGNGNGNGNGNGRRNKNRDRDGDGGNRRRNGGGGGGQGQGQGGPPGGIPQGAIPFQLPQGASLLSRPDN